MPALEQMDLTDKALLWETTGSYDQYGQYAYEFLNSPIHICVRWVHGRHTESGPDGNPMAIDVTVIANRLIKTGSLLWRGSLADLPGTGTAAPETDLMIVDERTETKDIKGRVTRYEYRLRRFKDTLPTEGG